MQCTQPSRTDANPRRLPTGSPWPAIALVAAANWLWLAGCQSSPTSAPAEPSLGLSTPEAAHAPQPIKVSEAVEASPELTVTRSLWQFEDAAGTLITTPNYRLYTTVEAPSFLDRLPLFYERALEQYTSALAPLPQPSRKLETFLFQSRRQWQAKTAEMLPEQADMFANLGRGGFTTRGTSVLYYIDRYGYPRDTFAIAAHEGWHQYTQQTFKHQLPIWLEEGVATYMEGYRRNAENMPEFNPTQNSERRRTLQNAVRDGELIALQELLTRSPQSFLNESKDSLLTYYAQVWALTRFLAEGEDGRYREALGRILLDAAQGELVGRMAASPHYLGPRRRGGVVSSRVGPAVVQEYFTADLAAFETSYLAFVDQLVQSRGDYR